MSIKEKLKKGEIVVGPFVIIPSVTMVDTLGFSGMDFCILDTEHGPLSIETANELVIAAHSTGISPIIRVGSKEEWPILRALDIGSDGVQVPLDVTIDSFKRVAAGEFDHLPEAAFYMVGGIEDVIAKAEELASRAA